MDRIISIATIIGIVLLCVFAEEKLYSDRYDDINITDIFNNNKLRRQYYKCFMDIAPCVTGDAKFFKDIFSEAFTTNCRKCTSKQKQLLEMLIEWYTENENEEWQDIVKKALEDARKKNTDQ